MLRKIRIVLAAVFFLGLCLLFLDFTGAAHAWLGWMAKIQFVPAALALNFGIVALLIVLTLLIGRVYCSAICPLGVMQDIVSWIRGKAAKKNRFRFRYRKARNILRYSMLALFIVLAAAGLMSVAALIEPYSSFGRIASNLFAPIYAAVNNLFALAAERAGSYAFYGTDVWIKSIPVFCAAVVIFILIVVLAWEDGRIWCNTICPVGTVLGLLSRFSLFAPVIDTNKCNGCGLCGRGCKASCIDSKEHCIDTSRCVACMDCIGNCRQGAIKYKFRYKGTSVKCTIGNDGKNTLQTKVSAADAVQPNPGQQDKSRRSFINSIAIAAGTATIAALSSKAAKAQEMKTDGGITKLLPKQEPKRETPIVPAGAKSLKNFTSRCISCQLCVSVCPNQVLRPSLAADELMQPKMSYERGFCRPECTRCSEVCPAGAITRIDREEKSDIKIGTAIVDYSLCVPANGTDSCGNCARHCPSHAIMLVAREKATENKSFRVPVVKEEQCIGCGACEYLCPSRPISAIKVNGIEVHHERS